MLRGLRVGRITGRQLSLLKFFLRLDILRIIAGGYLCYKGNQPIGAIFLIAGLIILILRLFSKGGISGGGWSGFGCAGCAGCGGCSSGDGGGCGGCGGD